MVEFWARLFFIFIFYSFSGWVIETIRVSLREKRFVNRGFLLGPYCPVYGFGAVSLDILLSKFVAKPVFYFFLAFLIAAVLEYFTSFIMEKIFHARWWDYSDRALNLNGRICAENLLQFAFFGTIVMCFVNRRILTLYYMMMIPLRYFVMLALFLIALGDTIISASLVKKIKSDIKMISKDNTREISEKVRELIKKRNIFHRRLFKAYPGIKLMIKRIQKDKGGQWWLPLIFSEEMPNKLLTFFYQSLYNYRRY